MDKIEKKASGTSGVIIIEFVWNIRFAISAKEVISANCWSMCFFVHIPIANKKDQSTDHKKAHHIEVGFQMGVFIFNVQHWYA